MSPSATAPGFSTPAPANPRDRDGEDRKLTGVRMPTRATDDGKANPTGRRSCPALQTRGSSGICRALSLAQIRGDVAERLKAAVC
jgi:hypothetical protein